MYREQRQYTETSCFQQKERKTRRKQTPELKTQQQPQPEEDGKVAAIHASS